MGRKEAVVAQPISLTWLCMDRVERTRQIPSVPYCTYRILDWYLCPLTRVSAQLWLKNGMWGCGGFMSLASRLLCGRQRHVSTTPDADYKYSTYSTMPDSADPSLLPSSSHCWMRSLVVSSPLCARCRNRTHAFVML